jgi:hypothetical protein
MRVRVATLLVLGLFLTTRALPAQPVLEGLSLEAAIEALEAEGLKVFFSSELVKPTMRVVARPGGRDAREWLRAILAPHGLTIVPGPRGSVLIVAVRESRTAAFTAPAVAARGAVPRQAREAPAPIDELVVSSSRYAIGRDAGAADFLVAGGDLERLPDLGDDALRAVQRLPGIAANGFSARSSVRGGATDETLMRLDGLRLYEPFHLASFPGPFSAIDPSVVGTMEVYTGGFPVSFGDRMSGVVDVRSLDPPDARYTEVAVSFFNASVLNAGRFASGDGEWLASIRRSNLDLLYDRFTPRAERPRYVDGFGKIAYRVGDTLKVSVNTLYSRDDIELFDDVDAEERASSRDEQRYTWLRFDHDIGSALYGSTLLAHTSLAGDRGGVRDKQGVSAGRLLDRRAFTIDSLQGDWSWQPDAAADWLVTFGAAFDRARGRYDYEDEVVFELLFAAPGVPAARRRARDIEVAAEGERRSLYGTVRYRPAPRVTLDLGLRWDEQTLDPEPSGALTPRVGLRYGIAEHTFLRAAWGRFEQAQTIDELEVSDGVRDFHPPQRAEHRVLGLEHVFEQGVRLRVELYDKEMSRLRLRHENLLHALSLLPELEPDRVRIAPSAAVARGLEIRVDSARGAALGWWASYSRSTVRDRVDGAEVARSWDQPHALSGGLSWTTSRWDVGAALNQRSGWPTTAVLGLDESGALPRVVTGPRNAERVGEFRSVDLRVTRTFAAHRGTLNAFLEVTNAFGRSNPCCLEYQIEADDEGAAGLELSPLDYLPRVPSLGFVWSF